MLNFKKKSSGLFCVPDISNLNIVLATEISDYLQLYHIPFPHEVILKVSSTNLIMESIVISSLLSSVSTRAIAAAFDKIYCYSDRQ